MREVNIESRVEGGMGARKDVRIAPVFAGSLVKTVCSTFRHDLSWYGGLRQRTRQPRQTIENFALC